MMFKLRHIVWVLFECDNDATWPKPGVEVLVQRSTSLSYDVLSFHGVTDEVNFEPIWRSDGDYCDWLDPIDDVEIWWAYIEGPK